MKPADESLLSAYLDGELDLATRSLVETAAQDHPKVADRLAELAEVRDLVANLPRGCLAMDFSGVLVSRIAAERAGRIRRARSLLMASCLMASAAAMLLATSNTWMRAEPAVARFAPAVITAVIRPPAPLPPSIIPLAVARPLPTLLPSSIAIPSELLAAEQQARSDAVALEDLMAGSEAREILVEVDDLDEPTLDKVEGAIRVSNRREPKHAQIHLYQEIAADPLHPGRVAVYLLVMDDAEKKHFGRNLEAVLPGSAKGDVPADADLVAQLPRIGRMEMRGGLPRGTLLPPPIHLASQEAFRHDEAMRPDEADAASRPAVNPRNPDARPLPGGEEHPGGLYVVVVTTRDAPRPRLR